MSRRLLTIMLALSELEIILAGERDQQRVSCLTLYLCPNALIALFSLGAILTYSMRVDYSVLEKVGHAHDYYMAELRRVARIFDPAYARGLVVYREGNTAARHWEFWREDGWNWRSSLLADIRFLDAMENEDVKGVAAALLDGASPNSGWFNYSALARAIWDSRLDIMRTLLIAGADVGVVTVNGMTALGLAMVKDCSECFDMLLRAGADPNELGAVGRPALWAAVHAEKFQYVTALVNAGADMGWRDEDGLTVLHFAAGVVSRQMVELLLLLGASPTAVDGRGNSPLHFAVSTGSIDVMEVLVDAGANVNWINFANRTALCFASEDATDKIDFLREHGADAEACP